jgi:hypothetical protein
MHTYRVVEGQCAPPGISLLGRNGRFHLARALNGPPMPGVLLRGNLPRVGFELLVCEETEAVFRVIFEQINSLTVEGLRPGVR